MWGFSEEDVERFLTQPGRGRKTGIISIDDDSYVVLRPQAELAVVDDVRRNPQKPLFEELGHLKEFLPYIEGKPQVPDIITYRKPKTGKQLVVFELKNGPAEDKHVAQLRRYVNLLQYYVDNNVENIKGTLGLAGGKFAVRGVLLARSVSREVWLGACLPYDSREPQIELIAYELESDPKRPRVKGIRYCNFTKHYAGEFRKVAKKQRSYRRKPRQRSLLTDT